MTYNVGHVWAGPTLFEHVRARTPLKHRRARTPLTNQVRARIPPYLSIKPCLHITSFGNLLLLFIAMTHAGCGLKLYSVTKNNDDISYGMFEQHPT